MKKLFLSFLSLGLATCGLSQTVTDSFNGNLVNASKWEAIAAYSDTTVTENNGSVSLKNGGKILSQASFGNPIEVNGRFRFSGNVHDNFIFVFRTTSQTHGGGSIELTNGIAVRIEPVNDTSSSFCTFLVQRMNDSFQFGITNRTFAMNQFYNFRITDDGTNFSFYFDNMTTPLLSGSDTLTLGNRVGFYNREGAGNGSSISAGSQVDIDWLDISSPGRNPFQAPFNLDLVAWYPFNNSASDESGNGNHATAAGNYLYLTNGFSGGTFRTIGDFSQFYAGGGHAMLPAFSSNLNSGFTASVWVKDEVPGTGPVDAENYVFFSSSPSDDSPKAWISLNNWSPPFVGYLVGNGAGQAFNPWHYINMSTYPDNWKHLVIVSAPDKFACYFNGAKVFQTNVSYSIFPAPYSAIGRHWWPTGSSARMSATYDNFRLFSRALTDQDIQQLYELESGPRVALIKAVKPLLLNLSVGTNYQLQLSSDLQNWTNHNATFTATNSSMVYPQYWDVDWGSLYFRLQVAP